MKRSCARCEQAVNSSTAPGRRRASRGPSHRPRARRTGCAPAWPHGLPRPAARARGRALLRVREPLAADQRYCRSAAPVAGPRGWPGSHAGGRAVAATLVPVCARRHAARRPGRCPPRASRAPRRSRCWRSASSRPVAGGPGPTRPSRRQPRRRSWSSGRPAAPAAPAPLRAGRRRAGDRARRDPGADHRRAGAPAPRSPRPRRSSPTPVEPAPPATETTPTETPASPAAPPARR